MDVVEVVVLAAVVEVDVHVWRGTCRNQVLRGSSVVVLGEMHVDGSPTIVGEGLDATKVFGATVLVHVDVLSNRNLAHPK